jgi:sialate O-acetylesterase
MKSTLILTRIPLTRIGLLFSLSVALTALLLAPLAALHAAEIKPAGLFSPNAVLQRDRVVPVWGQAAANAKVTVEFAGQKKDATADADGKWLVRLDPLPANPVPGTLTLSAPPAKPVMVGGLVVGDVFLCAGGSEVGKRDTDAGASPEDSKAPPARVFVVTAGTSREVQGDVSGRWVEARNSDLSRLPAQAFHLGRMLAAEHAVPVGIISVSVGNAVESWMSRQALEAAPEAAPILAYYGSDAWKIRTVGTYEERVKAWTEYCQKLPLNPPPKPLPDDGEKLAKQEPSGVWNFSIAPLTPMALRGVIWDSGGDGPTFNTGSMGRALQQGQLLPAMFADWGRAFGDENLPFFIVELRPHRYAVPAGTDGRLAAELREAQRAAATDAKATLVTTIDMGAGPKPRDVTARIASAIQARVFQKAERDLAGPTLVKTETTGDKVTLHFTNTRGGLKAKGGELKGFAIASSLLRWVWADAKIEGDTVILSAPTVPNPDGVRYAYEDLPSRGASLTDALGNPAAPFRTDTHLSVSGANLDPGAQVLRYTPRSDLGMEDPRLPRILIIGDSISGHYLSEVRELMQGKANIIGESSMGKGTWASMGPNFFRSDQASKGDNLKNFLAERGPFDIVHFNNGIHNFAGANPGDEKPYAEQLRTVVATIRASGAVCLFANSTGTIGDNLIPRFPNYLSNCQRFNAAAEALMKELKVPVTDIYGLMQPRIKELISTDLIHPKAEAKPLMAELIANRLNETLATLPKRKP